VAAVIKQARALSPLLALLLAEGPFDARAVQRLLRAAGLGVEVRRPESWVAAGRP
jgi:hypothetical protein